LNYRFEPIDANTELRETLESKSKDELAKQLQTLDSNLFNNWNIDTKRRIIRGIELAMGNGNPVIIGYDAISALGIDLEQQWQDALAGKSGIGPLSRFPLKDNFPVRISGQCPDIPEEYNFPEPIDEMPYYKNAN